MGTWFWINIPLMVLAFALTTGLSYALLRRGRSRPANPATSAPAVAFAPAITPAPAATPARTVRTSPAAA